MNDESLNTDAMRRTTASPGQIRQGLVSELLPTGEVLVTLPRERSSRKVVCNFLEISDRPALSLEIGDRVLVLMPQGLGEEGCVLGRIGIYQGADAEYAEPKHIVIEAKKELKLKCGDSSIELRRDGKLLIKGVDVVANAKRTNRIKGGSVQIN
jgi:hypothetical protein